MKRDRSTPARSRSRGPRLPQLVLASLLSSLGVAAGASLLLCTPAQAQSTDPWADWRSADSAHFSVHYRGSQRAQAEQVARAAERAWTRITQSLAWEPAHRIELVVYSEYDQANGYSTPLPYNIVGAFLAPPEGELLDNSPWLDLLLTHELTHAIHLDKVRGAPKVLRHIFGRVGWFFPNLFEPTWTMEGLAVWHEGAQDGGVDAAVALGRGRLYSPEYEGWLRAEQRAGFLKLAELNADGRALPLAKNYLYGAYFFDWLARRHGVQAVSGFVENYSGNIVPRLHTNPRELTGKTMDLLWDEFLADLDARVSERAAALRATPEVVGAPLGERQLDVSSIAALPDGRTLAVVNDGLGAPQLMAWPAGARPDAGGASPRGQVLAQLLPGARLDVSPAGEVLLTQVDLCRGHYWAWDVYRWTGRALERLTECAHLRRASRVGDRLVALEVDAGATRLVSLDLRGRDRRVLHAPPAGTDLADFTALADNQRVAVLTRRDGDWQLLALDTAAPDALPQRLLQSDTPLHTLRSAREGSGALEFISARDGIAQVWRLQGGQLQRLTHSHTGVLTHGGTQADGALAVAVATHQGQHLQRQDRVQPVQTVALGPDRRLSVPGHGWARPPAGAAAALPTANAVPSVAPAATPAPPTTPGAAEPVLGDGGRYWALRHLYPRGWWPAVTSDRGLTAYGATVSGADPLGWHQYAATLQWETSQREALGSLQYVWLDDHLLSLTRSLSPRSWRGGSGDEVTLSYERHTQAQWLSTLPWLSLERRVRLGIGAAVDRVELRETADASATPAALTTRDDRLAAALLDVDTRGANWWSEGANRGWRATLLYETYKPFLKDAQAAAGTGWNGWLWRADLRGHWAVGRQTLALRYTEAQGHDRIRGFQLGGATDAQLQSGYVLNSRDLSLRGYRGDEPDLYGTRARIASLEWRTPLLDADWHGMVPPLGLNRLSAATFFDAGGAWAEGASRPQRYHRGVGVELLAELKLLYQLDVQARLGLARALDGERGTRAYFTLGRSF